MPILDNIFPAANNFTAGDHETAVLSGACLAKGEPFDQVMSQALSPREANAPSAQNRRQQTNFSNPQKRNSADLKAPPTPVRAGVDSPTADVDTNVSVKTKAGSRNGEDAGKAANKSVASGTGHIFDGSRNAPILLLAPALAACLLKSLAPVPASKSYANDPPVAAVLPVGPDGKGRAAGAATLPGVDAAAKQSVAAAVGQLASSVPQKTVALKTSSVQKSPAEETNAETTGVCADGAMISGLAGAGQAAPQKCGAISTDDSLPDDSGPPVVSQNPAAEPALVAPVKSSGTSVAKQDVPMKNAEQTNQIAGPGGPGEKVLPGDAVPAGRVNILSVRGSFIPVPARIQPSAANAAPASAVQDNPVGGARPVDEATVVATVSDLRSQALDRTHDLVMQQALRLVDAKSDSLHVVLMPEAGTKLSLELRQRGHGIEAQAVLQAGDFEKLKQHWPELQQRLEQRGIKLAPLTSEGNSAMWSGRQGSKNQPEQSSERESFLAGAFAGFVPADARNNLPAEPAILAASSRGWQTWA